MGGAGSRGSCWLRPTEQSNDQTDELSVDSLISQILDKSIAVDEIDCKVLEGPNNLEEVDELRAASNG